MQRYIFMGYFLVFIVLSWTVAACSQTDTNDSAQHEQADSSDVDASTSAGTGETDLPGDDAEPAEPDDAGDLSDPSDGSDSEPSDESDPADCEPSGGAIPGFGDITGLCGFLEPEVRQQLEPMMVINGIDFSDDPYDEEDLLLLTEGGQEIIADGNAGGSSLLSEVFSFEVLARCEQAELLKTETEIVYDDPAGKKTDLLVRVGQSVLGVSVTRAVGFPREDPYTVETAQALLEQKLSGVNASTANMSDEDIWSKQILHIVAYADEHAVSLETAYDLLSDEVRNDTVVIVTVSHGEDGFLY
ncbi:MAG: hypothetical protein HOI23_19035 [Deltaproteobacteria bacterium]|jgi:hypothetical protein|nr:hypothetical protein [Deltaproteobacteria bacterium]MBT6436252.1 hypothetical protein [Deltaproteobacteria bacterium]MBT6490748.1 hypothetical protein [Deltaproteobacteria bacterium]